MGFRNEVFFIEWVCLTTLTLSFPLEYLCSVILVLVTYPVARLHNSMKLSVGDFFQIDFSLTYLVVLFTTFPYFVSTLVYLCRKRQYLIDERKNRQTQAELNRSHHSDSE